jgi:hypothetical protein
LKTLIRTCLTQGCRTEVPTAFANSGFCLEHYVADAAQKLNAAKDSFCGGRSIDGHKLDWLLAQVDFVVETMGNEAMALGDQQRSKLLDLLLGVANLNEQIRRANAARRQAV